MIPPYLLQAAVLSEKERFNPRKPPITPNNRTAFSGWFNWTPWAALAFLLFVLACFLVGATG